MQGVMLKHAYELCNLRKHHAPLGGVKRAALILGVLAYVHYLLVCLSVSSGKESTYIM